MGHYLGDAKAVERSNKCECYDEELATGQSVVKSREAFDP